MESDRSNEAERRFNESILSKFPGFSLISRAGVASLVSPLYGFSLKPVLGPAVRGIVPSEVSLSDSGDERVVPFLGFYSFGMDGTFSLFGTYLVNRSVLPSVLQRLAKSSSYKGRVGGPELRDLFSDRVSGSYYDTFSRDKFVFRLMPDLCPVRGVLLDKSYDAPAIDYIKSQGWLKG